MSLRSKILYILFVVVALYAAVDNGTLRLFASRFFESWELREAEDNVASVVRALDDELDSIGARGRIWASWSELRDFVDGEDEGFAARNLGASALDNTGVDVFYVLDETGSVRWSLARDPESGEEISLRSELPAEALSPNHPLRLIRSGEEATAGVMMTSRAPLLVVSTPIPDAAGEAFEKDDGSRFRELRVGCVIFGKFLDENLRQSIGERSNIAIDVLRADDVAGDEDVADLVSTLTATEESIVSYVDDDGKLRLYASKNDIRTLEPLLVEATAEREIVALGSRAVDYALLSTFASALLILFVLLRLLHRIVLAPLGMLTSKAVEIGKTDDTTIRVGLVRDDEIGLLSTEFDRMLDELAHSRDQVVKTARKAGMSEIATGVLHNVGNVLNSVNVSANLVTKNAEKLSVKDLEMMVSVLKEHDDDLAKFVTEDPRGKHVLPFLYEITTALAEQRGDILGELENLCGGIDHISDLVRSQQTYAGTKGVFELASLETELEAAIHICTQALGRMAGVEIAREFDEIPSVDVDKHKLMEILVNLIQNAHQALDGSGQAEKKLTLRVLQTADNTARIEVEDNGVGISEENLVRVFNHGFTTKQNGHGFGLHVSANAATEMNASLQVRSPGPGKGTTFFLDIPIRRQERANAA